MRNNFLTSSFLEEMKNKLSHTNLIIIQTPFWENKTNFNSIVRQNNLAIYSTFNGSATIVNSSTILSKYDFTKFGLHLNYNGKLKLLSHIRARILTSNAIKPTTSATTDLQNDFFLERSESSNH